MDWMLVLHKNLNQVSIYLQAIAYDPKQIDDIFPRNLPTFDENKNMSYFAT